MTDAGLAHLAGLTNLTALDLSGTSVTDAGVAAPKEKLPGRSDTWVRWDRQSEQDLSEPLGPPPLPPTLGAPGDR